MGLYIDYPYSQAYHLLILEEKSLYYDDPCMLIDMREIIHTGCSTS